MSMMQKLETYYLAILRFVVITASGLLLAAAILFMVFAISGLWDWESAVQPAPKVAPNDIVSEIAKTPETPREARQESRESNSKMPNDSNNADYQRTANTIVTFVNKYGRGQQNVDFDRVMSILKQHAGAQPTPALTKAFASGMLGTIEQVFGDQKVIALVSRPMWVDDNNGMRQEGTGISPVQVANLTLDQYAMRFNRQVMQAKANEEKRNAEQENRKEDAMFKLYAAVGSFCVFLLLVFLSIIIRIERNLRPLPHLEKAVCD